MPLIGSPLLLRTESPVTWTRPSWTVLSFFAQTAQSRGHVPHGQSSPSPHRQPSHVDMSVMGSLLLLRTDSLVTWTCPSWAVLSFSAQAAQSRGHVRHGQSSPSPHRQPSHVDMSAMGSPLLLRTDSPVTWTCPSWAVLSFSAQTAQSRGHVPLGQSSPSPHRQPSHVDMSLTGSLLLLHTDSLVTWTCPSWAVFSFSAQTA